MSMEVTAWTSLYHAMNAQQDARPFSQATLRRIAAFARPHRGRLAGFLCSAWCWRCSRWPRRCSPAGWSTRSCEGAPVGVVVGLAVLIAVIAVAEAGLGLLTRWLSAGIGEGLILDLRTAVFDHVQRMPVAFFTRTRTGALVSRLNNDVIGAQRAFSDTLSGVVSNLVTLAAHARRDARHLLADHAARAGAAAGLRAAGPADGQPAGPAASARRPTTTRR